MGHLILTRFAVPRPEPESAARYRSREWLDGRFDLFRRFFVPSVARLGVPAVLLCGSEVAGHVASRVADLDWVRVEVQDDWRGGLPSGYPLPSGTVVTRLDSDDAVRHDWLDAVDRAPRSARICITGDFLRWDIEADRLHRYRRREPSPLAAFHHGENPYRTDHKHLLGEPGVHRIPGAYLLEIHHGGNLSNRRPKPWRLDRLAVKARLRDFLPAPG